MDDNGYPTEDELKRIREWPANDLTGLFDYLRDLWAYPTYFKGDGPRYEISTGGWSGNESLIDALQENRAAWLLSWQSSERGGHFVFEVPAYQVKP